ncbi:hypothetical protein TELCIR_07288 [Teladorsagia circumcincta]|uniref:Neurotransmitter-gated ion-channel ligand-binding domain-containing protein n=1 Tax=Teladorsagia circumcincta TaxID=45464 RepID=A0A2G9UKP2_TELCI|nr:hypothetical protein TELCIR_07288 [Teladorsagia circumcincta]
MRMVESEQKVDFIFEYEMEWDDERLKWDPSEHCGLTHVHVPWNNVWVPELGMALTNIMSLTFILGILANVLPKTDELPKIDRTQFLHAQSELYKALMQDYEPKLSAISALGEFFSNTKVEAAQKVDITMEYKMSWTDERLSWNPADYCGIDEIYLSREDVWVPVASLGNGEWQITNLSLRSEEVEHGAAYFIEVLHQHL